MKAVRSAKKMVMAGQPTLMDSLEEEYVEDIFISGTKPPLYLNRDHANIGMRKPFVAWDGEGYTDEWGKHHYWLLANSLGDKLIAPPGRSIERFNALRLFHRTQARIPGGIQVGFALGYDFTMLLRANGLAQEQLDDLKLLGYMKSDDYVMRLMMGKQLTTWLQSDGSKVTGKFNLQDTWGFFQRSFVKALDEYFPQGWPHREIIMEMKAKRSKFTRADDAEVLQYNDMELELLVMLMEDLRTKLFRAGMPIARWYGPGAIANGLFQQWKIKETLVDYYVENPNLATVLQYAYAGGRFELLKPGHSNRPVYQYDINSAYPYAIAHLPNLKDGEWRHVNAPALDDLPRFSVVRIRWGSAINDPNFVSPKHDLQAIYPEQVPFPFWRRNEQGAISYPASGVHGWYWLPEVKAGIAYGDSLPDYYGVTYSIEEAYCFEPDTSSANLYPFSKNFDLYERRQVLKAKGDGAHIGLKLGLNSEYGKTCQQVGYDPAKGQKPPYHNLALAGYVTSVCRAMMLLAMAEKPMSVVAFETDAIFSLEPLSLPVSTELGKWDLTEWDDMWYYQSGFRFGIKDGQVLKPATRGIPVKDISLEVVRKKITDCLSSIPIMQTQFMTLQWAQALGKPDLAGQWREIPKVMHLMCEQITGKRIHHPDCYMCDENAEGVRTYRWSESHITVPRQGGEGQMNAIYKVAWSKLGTNDDPDSWEGVIEP